MIVVVDSYGAGGSATGFTVGGNVTGNVTLPEGAGFTIGGQLGATGGGQTLMAVGDITDGFLTIGNMVDAAIDVGGTLSGTSSHPGGVWIKNGATESSVIEVTTMGDYATIQIGDQQPVTANAWINVTSSGVAEHSKIDLSQAEMTGTGITLGSGGTYYDVAGDILVGEWNGTYLHVDDVTGTGLLDFDRVESGSIIVHGDVASTGLIDIDEDLAGGLLEIKGSLLGDVAITGDVTGGELEVEGTTSGDVTVTGAMSGGEIELWDSVSGTVSVGSLSGTGVIDLYHSGTLTGAV